ncbi:catechol 1,2-dioxygenase, partial [Actinomadura sp. KC345]
MSDIVLGVGASHSTLMNTDWDKVDHLDDAHRFRDGLERARDRLLAAAPDAVVIIGSNHFRGFFLDMMPAITVGVGE